MVQVEDDFEFHGWSIVNECRHSAESEGTREPCLNADIPFSRSYKNYFPANASRPLLTLPSHTTRLSEPTKITPMNSTYAVNFFRSCTTSLSSRTLTKSSFNGISRRSRQIALSTRHYSDQSNGSAEQTRNGDKAEPLPSSDSSSGSETLAKLKAKETEVVDLTGRLRYLQADFLNLQRNAAREKEQTRDFAISRFATDLLETVDVLALALKSVPKSLLPSADSAPDSPPPSPPIPTPPTKTAADHLNELYTGVEMTQRQLLQTLFKYHVKPFDPIGDQFDPNRHEALYQAPVPDTEPGTIIDVQKIGYTIKDRVLRAAQVGVAQELKS